MSELDYLLTLARQRGDAEALRIAADDLGKLRAALAVSTPIVKTAQAFVAAKRRIMDREDARTMDNREFCDLLSKVNAAERELRNAVDNLNALEGRPPQ